MWYIVDDERRRIHLATPMRPEGSGPRGPAAALLLLDDERASSAAQRLASDSPRHPERNPVYSSKRPRARESEGAGAYSRT